MTAAREPPSSDPGEPRETEAHRRARVLAELVDVFGTVVAEAGSEEALLYADLDLALARQKDFVYTSGRFETRWFADRRTLYGPIVDPDLWPQTARRAREAAPTLAR
jgi:hypothetical protein